MNWTMNWTTTWALLAALFGVGAVLIWGWLPPDMLPFGAGLAAAALAAAFGGASLLSLAGFAWCLGRGQRADPVASYFLSSAEVGGEGFMITGPGSQVLYVNDAFLDLFDLGADEDSFSDALKQRLSDDEDSAQALSRLIITAASETAAEADVMFVRHQNGQTFQEWRRLMVRPAGDGVSVLWRAEDVTPETELEIIRRQEEDLLADFLDRLPAGFFSVDGEGRIVYANETLAAWLGVSAKDMSVEMIPFSEFVVEAEEIAGDAGMRTPTTHGRVTLRTASGDTFKAWLIQSEQNDGDGNLHYSRSVILRDMVWRPEGKTSEPDLSDQRLRWLFEEAPVGIVILNLQGEVADCNRAFLKLIGRHKDTVVSDPFSQCIVKEDRSDVAGQLSKVVMGILRAAHLDVRMPAAGQREVAASLYASRMEDEFGEVSGLVLHFIDSTEQKDLEVQFAQSQKMQAVGQLAGGVAHDFNNLLTAMTGFCDLLLARHGADDPSFADIMQIKQNTNRATNLVRQLLAFSRKQRLLPEMLDPTELLSDLTNLLSRLIGANIELEIEHKGAPGQIRADRGQFDQVIINLAVNARDAMLGGGTLTVRTSDFTLDAPTQRGLELIPAGSYVLIEVADTGTGISKENIGSIFEPFFSTKGVGEGTGLGLSTVYGIVHQSDGFIFVESAPGEGTTFSICLPRYEGARAQAPASARGHAVRGGSHGMDAVLAEEDLTGVGTVLLVEDEDAVRMFGAKALRGKGYKVLEASDGEAALDVINATEDTIDLIISDVVMPGMDGPTFVQLVRQEMGPVKVILISGYAEDVIPGEISQAPDIHFLPKPFTLADLAGKVKDVLTG